MNGRRVLRYASVLMLVVLVLAGCGGASSSDVAVCDAYQDLVDAWPASAEEVDEASSAEEIWGPIEDAGEGLVEASEAADTPELAEAGRRVGEAAAGYYSDTESTAIAQGFIPFFTEDLIGGSELSALCEEIGRPITLP